MDFVSSTGSFTLSLPTLAGGLSWDTANLLTSGVLAVTGGAVNDADFDNDGDVDGGDFLTWQRGLGTSPNATSSQGDADGNGIINAADLTIWRQQFGPSPVEAGVGAVPEPTSALLAAAALMAGLSGARTLNRR